MKRIDGLTQRAFIVASILTIAAPNYERFRFRQLVEGVSVQPRQCPPFLQTAALLTDDEVYI